MKKRGLQYIGYPELPSSNNTNVGSMQCQIESFAAGWPLGPLGGKPIIGLTALQTPGKLVCILTCTKIPHQLSTNSLFQLFPAEIFTCYKSVSQKDMEVPPGHNFKRTIYLCSLFETPTNEISITTHVLL